MDSTEDMTAIKYPVTYDLPSLKPRTNFTGFELDFEPGVRQGFTDPCTAVFSGATVLWLICLFTGNPNSKLGTRLDWTVGGLDCVTGFGAGLLKEHAV